MPAFEITKESMRRDLFGDIAVTHKDIFQWVQAVAPQHLRPENNYQNYIRSYDVISKIKQAKIDGTFEVTIKIYNPPWYENLT